MQSLLNFLHDESISSPFRAELSNRGGYITFSNSGRRGDTKYFQIGIDSILTTLKDILTNIEVFSRIQDYEEKPWRDNGSIYFSDPVANANSTVQTKPLFSTLSKIIKWANQPTLNNLNTDNRISITPDTLENTITKLNVVADSFAPHSNSKIVKPPLNEPLQIIYYGAPGTGKSFTIDDKTDDENSVRTTFHPDSDYASFVGAYKPTMEYDDIHYVNSDGVVRYTNPDKNREGRVHPGTEKKIVYKYVPQAFLKAYVAAWSDLDNPHFLVIEEINRGNCAQIFGDLFQLLDRNNTGSSSYAIHADEDITQFLAEDKNGFANLSEEQKDAIRSFVLIKDSGKAEAIGDAILSGKKLLLPPNLYIWATMNTSDQSLFPIDSAFKRRWNWEYMPIDYDAMNWQFEAGGKRYLWSDFLKKMNPLIYNLTQSSDKQMGYFFAKADKKTDDTLTENNLISEKIFLNKVLFYLWTDVLKDFEAGDKIFRDEEKGQMYQFSDFFPTTNGKLVEFVDKLELPEVGTVEKDNDEVNFDSPNDSELNDNNGNSQRDYSKYSVNGQGRMSKSDAVVAAMTAFVKALPELSATEILRKIDGFNLSNTIAYSEEDFNKYLEQSSDPRFTKRYARIETGTGESIYIYKGSTPKRIGELIQGLNNSGTGVILAKVE